jgi:23S rRNA pseudouridine1911/1915/1917 synthase
MKLEWTVPAGHGDVMLRKFILGECKISVSLWKRMKWGGTVVLNGAEIHNAKTMLRAGDRLVCTWTEESEIIPADIPLSVVYEDDWLLIVDKPTGMMIHPTHKSPQETLVNAVAGYFAKRGEDAGIHPVYRLDRNTTGLVVVAKSAKIQYDLSKRHDLITRHYMAFVSGHMETERGIIEAPIGRKDGSIVEWTVRDDGKPAVTEYEVLKRFDDFDVLRLRLRTGRTHQIRVHMSYLGHPLLGDTLYGGTMDFISRQALHAADVSFVHPVTGEALHFEAPLPQDMEELLSEERRIDEITVS